MGAVSNHYGDKIKWIEKIIDSCKHYEQTFVAYRMIRLVCSQIPHYLRLNTSHMLEHKLNQKRKQLSLNNEKQG